MTTPNRSKAQRGAVSGLLAKLTGKPYCGRCHSCGDAGCNCGLNCDGGRFCMYPGIREESIEWIEGYLDSDFKGELSDV